MKHRDVACVLVLAWFVAATAWADINIGVSVFATGPGRAIKNARKLVTEDKVDVLIGSSGVPASAVSTASST
jgi:ABC-type branched-subunit amino acid transport system substrate-binding protein